MRLTEWMRIERTRTERTRTERTKTGQTRKAWLIFMVLGLAGGAAAMAGAPLVSPAMAIEGQYSVEGRDPGGEQPYKGAVEVKRNGQTYAVVWRIGGLRQVGTGVVIDNVFSVVFQSIVPGRGVGRPGVAVFQIDQNRVTEGVWTGMGHSQMGQEIWTATDRY